MSHRSVTALLAMIVSIVVMSLVHSSRAATGPVTKSPLLGMPKRIYIANDEHTDYFWSGTDDQYRTAFQTMLDYYMAQADSTASNPSDSRGRFNCDGSMWAWVYERNRPPEDFARLMSHVRDGSISLPLQTCVMLYGAMPAEAVLRNMYYAGRLERRENLRFPLVVAMENQTLPGGVASLWAGAGAQYSWKGICNCATQISAGSRPREMYRFLGPDGNGVWMKWNSMAPTSHPPSNWIGGYAEARSPSDVVNYLDNDAGFASRWPWPVSAAFGYGSDDFETTTDEFIQASQSMSDSTRRVIVSNEQDFFEDFLSLYQNELPVFSGSFGNEWDLYTASMGAVTADFKRHVEKLRTAEALATIASLNDPNFMNGRETARDSAFLACGLYYEHDWTADGLVDRSERAQFQRDMLWTLSRYVDGLQTDAIAAVGGTIPQPAGVERHFVFNPLSWERTDYADLTVATAAPYHVVDLDTGAEVPSEAVTVNGAARARILAVAVPSVGYKVYEVRSGAGTTFPPSATVALPAFSNDIYRVSLGARGSITGLIDHKDGDLEYVNVITGGALNDLGNGSGQVTVERAGPVSTTLRVLAGGSPTHEAHVTLYSGIDRVDVESVITSNFSGNVAYTSTFNLPQASVRHEEVGMIARVARKAQGGDYADEDARTDYLTFNHFVDFSRPDRGVTISNWDSPFFSVGSSSVSVLDSTPVLRAVVGMQVDGPNLGITSQGNDSRFVNRFALHTHGTYDAGEAMRFALEHQNPFVSGPVTGSSTAPMPAEAWSLVSLPSPNIVLWALKPAEEGITSGVIARVWNLSDSQSPLSMSMPGSPIVSARLTTHIETDLSPATTSGGTLTDLLARQQMRTYRVFVQGLVDVPPPRADAGHLDFRLYPNPVRGETPSTITYTLPEQAPVRVSVHDISGATISNLVDRLQGPGFHVASWNGRDLRGARVPPGVYFVRVEAGVRKASSKIVRMR